MQCFRVAEHHELEYFFTYTMCLLQKKKKYPNANTWPLEDIRLNFGSHVCQITSVAMDKLLLFPQFESGDHHLFLTVYLQWWKFCTFQGKVFSSVHVQQLTAFSPLSCHTKNRDILTEICTLIFFNTETELEFRFTHNFGKKKKNPGGELIVPREDIPWILTMILNNVLTVFQNFVCYSLEQIFTEIIVKSVGNRTKYSQHDIARAVGTSSKHLCMYLQLYRLFTLETASFRISKKIHHHKAMYKLEHPTHKQMSICVFTRESCAASFRRTAVSS